MGELQTTRGSTSGTRRPDSSDLVVRALVGVVGILLFTSGVIAAFAEKDGVATAALLAAGFAMVFLAYLGPFITKIRFYEFEAELERFRQKASETLRTLSDIARSYESTRAKMVSGGPRDDAMSEQLAEAEQSAREQKKSPQELKRMFETGELGDRIAVLGAMRADPDLRDPEIVLAAIENPHRGFDQDRFLLLAGDMLHQLTPNERLRLRELIAKQRESGEIRPGRIRWLTSERLIRLMDR